jgi:site-specific recombinase XerD
MCAPRRAAAVVRPRGREKSADRRRRILISRLLIIRASVPRRKSPFPAYFKGFPAVSPLIPPYPAFLKYPVSPHYYRQTIFAMLSGIGKLAQEITTEDLRRYLTDYQTQRKSSKVTIDNIRRILSSYFSWMEDEDHIVKSPVRRIHKVKTAKVIKETYSDETLEIMRDNCSSIRDLAMIDLLASSGMRVGEMSALNRDDINFNERECVVFGKGSKERIVYFDARTKIHLQNYLESRSDSNPALFVSLASPHGRLQIGGIERRLRELGRRLDLPRVHPHKFRRTLATSAIDKGMPIEQVQQLLGHQKIDTTMHYAMVKQQNVKLAHRKYIG